MSLFLSRAKASTATTGTGTMTLGAGIAPYQSWSAAGALNGAAYPYLIEDGNDWELGYGTYSSSGATLTRNVTQSEIGGATGTTKLTLSGNATVACIARPEDMNEEGSIVAAYENLSTSSSFVDLATVGPSVTIVTGTSAFIDVFSHVSRSNAGNNAGVALVVSGATSIAAFLVSQISEYATGGFQCQVNRRFKLTGLTPGSNTFKMQYWCNGGMPWTFGDRSLCVKSSL